MVFTLGEIIGIIALSAVVVAIAIGLSVFDERMNRSIDETRKESIR